ncbi:MAG: hypothetical protein IJ323_06005 [Clostridia bacterium]|nr:hypothetical protein [Clostridia bacterium]MBQ8755793.1 hypothetical protein [Lentisphaeria bacterium]
MKILFLLLLVVFNFTFAGQVEDRPQEQILKEETKNDNVCYHLNADDINGGMAQQFLNGEITIDNYDGKNNLTVSEIGYFGTSAEYALADLEGDGARELVVVFDPSGDRVIIDVTEGVSTAYYLPIRCYNDIKKDGTASWSASAFYNGIRKIIFSNGQVEFEDIIVHNTYDGIFKVNGKDVSEEECNNALALQREKESVEWIEIE